MKEQEQEQVEQYCDSGGCGNVINNVYVRIGDEFYCWSCAMRILSNAPDMLVEDYWTSEQSDEDVAEGYSRAIA